MGKHFLSGIVCGFVAFLLSLASVSEVVELKCYDLFHRFKEIELPPREIVIVAIDEQSFDYFQKQWPWPRGIHAKLIETLHKRGVSVIGMDIVFADYSEPAEDEVLSRALEKSGMVVLASELEEITERNFSMKQIVKPLSAFLDYSHDGLINIPLDIDGVVRKFPGSKTEDSLFSSKIAEVYLGRKPVLPEDGYISFLGPPRSFKTISYYQAYDPDYFLPKDFFKNTIVIVGMGLKAAPDPARADLFATPYLFAGWSLMPGVEIHANIVNNILTRKSVRRLDILGRLLLLVGLGLTGSFMQIRWKPVRGFLIVLCSVLLCLSAVFYLFTTLHYWIPVAFSLLSVSLPYAVFGIDAYVLSERKRREIRKAFSFYVSPKVLDLILANPGMLRLGGTKENVTVMFADIANFTPLAESLQPEVLVSLLNRFFSEMTGIIFKYNGLVDKFIGDAIMAVWGCPVQDKSHALNAALTSVAMIKRMEIFRDELNKEGYPEIRIRIGLSSGEAIAGNMGSRDRFDYTVIGDTVNLASRLQDANKKFGTSILIDEAVYNDIEGRINQHSEYGTINLMPRGQITVKGKSREITVYEVCWD